MGSAVSVLSESNSAHDAMTVVEYRGRQFSVHIYTILDGDEINYGSDVAEIIDEVEGIAWDDSGNAFETSEAAYDEAIESITTTVDDDLDGTR